MNLAYDFSEEDFVRVCADRVVNSNATIFESIYIALSHFLLSPINENGIVREIRNKYKTEYYDDHLSLPEYISNGYLGLYYPTIEIITDKDTPIDIDNVLLPNFIQLESLNYGGGVTKSLKIKKHPLKTKNSIKVELLHLKVLSGALNKIIHSAEKNRVRLLPSKLGVWEWRQTFYNKVTGECFFCACFKSAIRKEEGGRAEHPHVTQALSKQSFREGICHICSESNSDLFFCSPMYASSFMVKYGAYVRKLAIDKNISERDAENRVREIKGVAKIGEKWINETLLFNYIDLLFPQYNVEREASPAWLGNQRIDIFIPEIKLAIEYQGQQHFKPVELFGGNEALGATKRRDQEKALKCKRNGIDLVYFTYKGSLSEKLVNRKLEKYLTE